MDNEGDSLLEYFKEATIFFKQVQWLYNMPVTKILLNGALNLLPIDWLKTLNKLENNELNSLVVRTEIQSDWPASLIDFVTSCKKLNKLPGPCKSISPVKLPDAFLKKLSIKKQHEIFHLAHLVHKQCSSQNLSCIVDLGSGLGYISQLLNHVYGYQVLGLESNAQNVQTAKIRQNTLFPESLSSVKYVCSNVTRDSAKSIEVLLQQQFGETGNICLIGLHACGDLSVYMSQVFQEMKKAQLLVLISCCYHKLTLSHTHKDCNSSEESEYFEYFPLSETFIKAINFTETDVGKLFRRPFLRLACQETSDRWKTMSLEAHQEHSFHVLARAILELYSAENELILKKLVRKATRKSQCSKFDIYLQDCTQRYSYVKQIGDQEIGIPWDEKMKSAIMALWNINAKQQKNVELYTALQLILQNAAESLVLYDRLCFLKEHGFKTSMHSTMDRSLSPRCYALVSTKNLNNVQISTKT
ncbi:hypothetical protein TSAR_002749 [Trichomalopsis sarcophagae]|uniref:Methyltransferase domain-containing protein n=1 Tax=Trichomalopsis sarcophagae TaxID=543379 RepID=A0A232ELR1_9HYME|nr:hypothetical protein TSAR_002749 [Trichomalopsis sarcophagae]